MIDRTLATSSSRDLALGSGPDAARSDALRWDELTLAIPPEVVAAPDGATVVGRYVRVGTRPLGSGAFGDVWKAYDKRLERWVALKIMRVGDDTARRDAIREAKTVGSLRHPHIAQLLDAGDIDQTSCYLAMELVDGETLESKIGRPLNEVVGLVRDAAGAVHFAHERGFVHRDLKPRNMMVERGHHDHVYVLDFGVARWMASPRAESQGRPVGTFGYMAPEQAQGEPADARSDVYALGATLYHLVTGRLYPPIEGVESWFAILNKVITESGPPPSAVNPNVDAELEAIVLRCLAKDSAARYRSADELAVALATWLDKRKAPPSANLIAGRYRLDHLHGESASARMHLATDTHTGETVVLKVYVAARRPQGVAAHVRVRHPNVLPVHDTGVHDGAPFVVMPSIAGAPLTQAPVTVLERVRLLRDVARAAHAVHEAGFHRLDVRPSNLIVAAPPDQPPVVYLADLDTAIEAGDAGAVVGSPLVMSPEQWRGEPGDRRVDVYAFGATLYRVLVDRYPTHGTSTTELAARAMRGAVDDLRALVNPAVAPPLAALVMNCLALLPDERPDSLADVARALDIWLGTNASPFVAPSASIRGRLIMSGPAAPERFTASVRDRGSRLVRREMFSSTAQFALHNLPAGDLQLVIDVWGVSIETPVRLTRDDTVTRDVEFPELVTATGRVVDVDTGAPIVGAHLACEGTPSHDEDLTDAAGRFTIVNVPAGRREMVLHCSYMADYALARLLRDRHDVIGSGVVDIGVLHAVRSRRRRDQVPGRLGAELQPDDLGLRVTKIDADGPLGNGFLMVGDIVVAVDDARAFGDGLQVALARLDAAGGTSVALRVLRDDAVLRVTLS